MIFDDIMSPTGIKQPSGQPEAGVIDQPKAGIKSS